MIQVLINAYACSPNKGSEPGMAWNWIIHLARECRLFVITEGEWQNEIEDYLERHKLKGHIKFYYNPVSSHIRDICWNQGDWRFYYYYRQWQKKTLRIAQNILLEEKIDLIHQLNMVGYREPGLLWQINGIPKVWGPIGGFGTIPNSYLELYSMTSSMKQQIKQIINKLQVNLPYIRNPIHEVDILVACNSSSKKVLEKMTSKVIPIIPEVGAKENNIEKKAKDFLIPKLRIAWVGKNDDRKALPIALKVFKQLLNEDIELNVYGISYEEIDSSEHYNNIVFHGWKPYDLVQIELRECHVLMFTSLFEATGSVVLEALSMGLPVICHNTCGQGDIIDSSCGYKVDMKGIDYSIQTFKERILILYYNRSILQELSKGAFNRVNELSWQRNSEKMVDIYKSLVNNNVKKLQNI